MAGPVPFYETPVPTTLHTAELPGLPLLHRGKVRDVFELPGKRLLMVATDRLSAFDVVLPDPIPGKGEMLCQISNFWFGKTEHIIPNHLTGIDVAAVLPAGVDPALYAQRAVVTKRLKPVPVECIARGYIIGSGWKDYQRTGAVCEIRLPDGLRQAERLPQPIFTPSSETSGMTKALAAVTNTSRARFASSTEKARSSSSTPSAAASSRTAARVTPRRILAWMSRVLSLPSSSTIHAVVDAPSVIRPMSSYIRHS